MPAQTISDADAAAGLEGLLTRAGLRGRTTIEKHLAACDAEPSSGHGKLWRRLAGKLAVLAPMPIQTAGPQAVMFFVADGKYRLQVFCLEDKRDGVIWLFMPNILAEALAAKVLVKSGDQYVGKGKTPMQIEALDASNLPDPAPQVKNMIGWNRKAIKITLDATDANSAQVEVAEAMSAIAAKKWTTPVQPQA